MEGKIVFILAMMLATYPVRLVPLLALSDRQIPDTLLRWLKYVPAAIFSAMVFPGLLIGEGSLAVAPSNPRLWAGAATLAAALATRNLSKAVAVGIMVTLAAQLVLSPGS